MEVLEQKLYREHEYNTTQMRPVNFNGPLFMESQPNVSKNMREILIDWLMEVAEEFVIKRDTVYVSVNFLDRYISMANYEIPKNEL